MVSFPVTSLFCIDLCGRSTFPHSASAKETAFSTRRVCHKSGLAAMHGRQPVHRKLRQMWLPRSSQDSHRTPWNDEVQILTCPNVLPETQNRFSYATWAMFDVMSGPQWSMWATATSREAKHGSLLKRHLGPSTSQQIGVLRACHFASGHRQRHRLRRRLRSTGWRWWPRLQELRARHALCQEFHNEHHRKWQQHPTMRAMPRWGKDLQCHCSGDDARFPGQKA